MILAGDIAADASEFALFDDVFGLLAWERPAVVLHLDEEFGVAVVHDHDGAHVAFSTWESARQPVVDDPLARAFLGTLEPRQSAQGRATPLTPAGLLAIYRFLRDREQKGEPCGLTEAFRRADAVTVILTEALSGGSRICRAALDLFMDLLGGQAARIARNHDAAAVYLTGRLATRLAEPLGQASGPFATAVRRGAVGDPTSALRVDLWLDPLVTLQGAARAAARAAEGRATRPVDHRASAAQAV